MAPVENGKAELGVLGTGAWGTALAQAFAREGRRVRLFGRDPARVAAIAAEAENRRDLAGVRLGEHVRPTARIEDMAEIDLLVSAVPAQATRSVLNGFAGFAGTIVIAAKGLEIQSGERLSRVVAAVCPKARTAVLSGPSFAREVATDLPTALVIAADRLDLGRDLAGRLGSRTLRLYPSDDLIGVEIGGALKNVVAIAAGVVMGRDLGENARAAIVTRGLAELVRLGLALGARRETLTGLSGLGDLLLTATSMTSRNTALGFELGRGRPLDSLLGQGGRLSEGAHTAGVAADLARKHRIEAPITQAVAAIIGGRWTVDEAIEALLSRPLRPSEGA